MSSDRQKRRRVLAEAKQIIDTIKENSEMILLYIMIICLYLYVCCVVIINYSL